MNILIGLTSQLSYFFPKSYQRISSRNTDKTQLSCNYDNVYLLFAEQRTFNHSLREKDFIDINVNYTNKIIDHFVNCSKRIVVYGTAELWNKHVGPINFNTNVNYKYSPYIKSKDILNNLILEKKESNLWRNVEIIHPVNFNSIKRKEGFLFYKIFQSIIKAQNISIGNINIFRDLIHPRFLARKSIQCKKSCVIGSGRAINVRGFIIDLYKEFGLDYFKLVKEEYKKDMSNNFFWAESKNKYNDLLRDTRDEIRKFKNTASQ